jgi:hypothetical protein
MFYDDVIKLANKFETKLAGFNDPTKIEGIVPEDKTGVMNPSELSDTHVVNPQSLSPTQLPPLEEEHITGPGEPRQEDKALYYKVQERLSNLIGVAFENDYIVLKYMHVPNDPKQLGKFKKERHSLGRKFLKLWQDITAIYKMPTVNPYDKLYAYLRYINSPEIDALMTYLEASTNSFIEEYIAPTVHGKNYSVPEIKSIAFMRQIAAEFRLYGGVS